MRKRLGVLLDAGEFREVRLAARRQRLTVAEWVRRALRTARWEQREADAGRKLAVVRAAAGHTYPTADIGRMLSEVESGFKGNPAA